MTSSFDAQCAPLASRPARTHASSPTVSVLPSSMCCRSISSVTPCVLSIAGGQPRAPATAAPLLPARVRVRARARVRVRVRVGVRVRVKVRARVEARGKGRDVGN